MCHCGVPNGERRIRKHRAKLRAALPTPGLCIGVTVIENIRRIARYKRQPTWAVIQQALETYVAPMHRKTTFPANVPNLMAILSVSGNGKGN